MNAFYGNAPGKVILFGEHSVVYGYPALAAPVTQVNAMTSITQIPGGTSGKITLEAPDIGIHEDILDLEPSNPLRRLIENLGEFFGKPVLPEMKIHIHSEIPLSAGMGSGAAISVAVIRAYAKMVGIPIARNEISSLAFEIEKIYHGTPSGIDNTVITYAKPVLYQRSQPIIPLRVQTPFRIIIADTGIKKETAGVVAQVHSLWLTEKKRFEEVFSRIGEAVYQARHCIETGSLNEIGQLMNRNQHLLEELGVSSPEIERLTAAALDAGADGAKLCGAGQGGNVIIYPGSADEEYIINRLRSAGAVQTICTTISNPEDQVE